MGITVTLQKACLTVLMQCWEFKDRASLDPLFGIEPLTRYAKALPIEAQSQEHLITLVIHRLVTYPATKGEPLRDLVGVLRDKRNQEEAEWKQLDELFKQVNIYLGSLVEKDPEDRKFHEAIRNYQIGETGAETDSESEAKRWIATVSEQPEEWAFRVALTVFNGSPWDACIEAALDLAKLVPPAHSTPLESAPPPLDRPQMRNRHDLLDEAGAELVSGPTCRIVKFKKPQLTRVVLDYVWDEYTHRQILIEWLSGLVVSPDFNKRLGAAIATGLLMLTNFDSIWRRVLLNWADAESNRSFHRAAIGRSLGVVAEEGTRLTEVRNLLNAWSQSSEQPLRWAAARAYIYVGGLCPIDEVIANWRQIAQAEDYSVIAIRFGDFFGASINPLHVSLLDAMEKFFLNIIENSDKWQEEFAEGLAGFKRWSDDEERAATREPSEEDDERHTVFGFGLLMFIKVARILVPGKRDSLSGAPVLLTLVDVTAPTSLNRQRLSELFERMLRDQAAQPIALDLLRIWLESVEREPQYEPQMRAVLDDLLARAEPGNEMRRLIGINLDLWSPRSRFQLHETGADIAHLRQVVLVVDSSESAVPFWTETRSIAFAIGSAFAEPIKPQVYLLSDEQPHTLLSLADIEPTFQNAPNSLIAPAMHDVVRRKQPVDALILIGNGEVFDLIDWLGEPLVKRWVVVRSGPDSLVTSGAAGVDEVHGDSLATIFERLCLPSISPTRTTPMSTTALLDDPQWRIDRAGYPMILVKPLGAYLHLFPITKSQFERFLATEKESGWGDDKYGEVLQLNPRMSYRATESTRFERLLLTGIKPAEATAFGNWLGTEFSLPDKQQWLAAFDWMETQPVPNPPSGTAEDAVAIWELLSRSRSVRTLLDLSLMAEGVKEWVNLGGKTEHFGALGRPVRRFDTLNRDARLLSTGNSTDTRLKPFGFRLLAR